MSNELATIILAAITSITTILMCIANYKSAKATREQVKEMQRQFEELNRPYINVEVSYVKSIFIALKFVNNGKSIANNVEIHFSKDFLNSLEDYMKTMLEVDDKKTCIIGVNQSYIIYLGDYDHIKNNCKVPASGDLIYYSNGKKYVEEFTIDLSKYKTFYSVS